MVYIAQNEADLRTVNGFSSAKLTRFANILRDNRERWSSGSYYINYPNNWLFPTEGRKYSVRLQCYADIHDIHRNRLFTQLATSFRPRVLFLDPDDNVHSVEGWIDVQGRRFGLNRSMRGALTTFRLSGNQWYGHTRSWGMGSRQIELPLYHPGVRPPIS